MKDPFVSKAKYDENIVYFRSKIGKFVFQSKDKIPIAMTGGRSSHETQPEICIEFNEGGTSRGFNMKYGPDRELVDFARQYIADAAECDYSGDYARVRHADLREVRPEAPPIPWPKWDETDAKKLPTMLEDLGKDVNDALLYEKSKGKAGRKGLIAALEKLAAKPTEPDPLAIPALPNA